MPDDTRTGPAIRALCDATEADIDAIVDLLDDARGRLATLREEARGLGDLPSTCSGKSDALATIMSDLRAEVVDLRKRHGVSRPEIVQHVDGVRVLAGGVGMRMVDTTPLEDPRHPVGSMRWTYIPSVDDWERCEVVAAYSETDMSFGRLHSELYDVRRPNGKISRGHFHTALTDMRRRAGGAS